MRLFAAKFIDSGFEEPTDADGDTVIDGDGGCPEAQDLAACVARARQLIRS